MLGRFDVGTLVTLEPRNVTARNLCLKLCVSVYSRRASYALRGSGSQITEACKDRVRPELHAPEDLPTTCYDSSKRSLLLLKQEPANRAL